MKCAICDKTLSEQEVVWNKETEEWEPCITCLEIALEAAYGTGFDIGDEDDYVPVLDDDDLFTSYVAPYEVGNFYGFDGGWDE